MHSELGDATGRRLLAKRVCGDGSSAWAVHVCQSTTYERGGVDDTKRACTECAHRAILRDPLVVGQDKVAIINRVQTRVPYLKVRGWLTGKEDEVAMYSRRSLK